jgi:hypothetical protein
MKVRVLVASGFQHMLVRDNRQFIDEAVPFPGPLVDERCPRLLYNVLCGLVINWRHKVGSVTQEKRLGFKIFP